MGKKKVAKQSEEALVREAEAAERTSVKAKQSGKHRIESGRIYIKASYNNTMITVTDDKGAVVAWITSGAMGFSGPKKATPFVASKLVEAIYEKMQRFGLQSVHVFVKGVGSGRTAALRALAAKGVNILSIRDVTPIPHNGPRPKKVRRV